MKPAIAALGYDYASQPKEPMQPCNLCGAEDWDIATEVDRYGYAAQATACRRCGQTVLNPRMTAEAYTEFYISVYRPLVSAFHGRLINAETIQDEQHDYAHALGDFIAAHAPAQFSTFLDIGGSTGIIAAHFIERFGVKATVIDPAPDETKVATELGIESVTGFVETWNPGDRRFDLIGLFQTIDHLMDVKGTFTKIRELLAPEGLFVFDIVDFRRAMRRNHSVRQAVKIDHVYSMVEETTEAYLARVGFSIVAKEAAPDNLHVRYLCLACPPQPEALPHPAWVAEFLQEIRESQGE